jgi:hypothetical protein
VDRFVIRDSPEDWKARSLPIGERVRQKTFIAFDSNGQPVCGACGGRLVRSGIRGTGPTVCQTCRREVKA